MDERKEIHECCRWKYIIFSFFNSFFCSFSCWICLLYTSFQRFSSLFHSNIYVFLFTFHSYSFSLPYIYDSFIRPKKAIRMEHCLQSKKIYIYMKSRVCLCILHMLNKIGQSEVEFCLTNFFFSFLSS